MAHDPDVTGGFGSGHDFEDGAYPSPPAEVTDRIETEQDNEQFPEQPPVTIPDRGDDDEKFSIDTFRGVVLSVVPPHIPGDDNTGQLSQLGSLFLGNGDDWMRVNFWGKVADRVMDFDDVSSNITVEVKAVPSEDRDDILDYSVFDDERTGVTRVDDSITYTPDSISTDAIKTGSLAQMVVGDVIMALTDSHRNEEGKTFDVKHMALDINGEKIVAELHDSHADNTVGIGDTCYVFAGWGKNKERFIHDELPHVEYKGKIWIRNYSGFRNVTRNPLPE